MTTPPTSPADHAVDEPPARSYDAVISQILRIQRDLVGSPEQEDDDFQSRRLTLALRNRQGTFGLLFAVCNEVPLRHELTGRISAGLPDWPPTELQLSGGEVSLLDTLLAAPGVPGPLIVYGIELLLPSEDSGRLLRQRTLQEMQMRRERFRSLGRPLLLWMPEYAYALIGQQAHDFWSWQSGGFFFRGSQPAVSGAAFGAIPRPTPRLDDEPPGGLLDPDVEGRDEEITALREALRGGRPVVVHGLAATGKTALARRLAREVGADYPDGQALVALGGTDAQEQVILAGLRQVIAAYQPALEAPDEAAALVAYYGRLLRGRRALIILDDVPDRRAIQPFLPPKGLVLLVTARHRVELPGAVYLDLDRLPPQSARRLLLRLAPHLTASAADGIAALCAYQPLALRLAGRLLAARPEIAPAAYAGWLGDQRRGVENTAADQSEPDAAITAAFALTSARLSVGAARLLGRLIVFPASFDAAAVAEIGDSDDERPHLRELLQLGLVTLDPPTERYRVPGPIRGLAAARLDGQERAAATLRHARCYLGVLRSAGSLYKQGGAGLEQGLDLFDREWTNIATGQAWTATHIRDIAEAATLCGAYLEAAPELLEQRLRPRERIRWGQAALDAARHMRQVTAESRYLTYLGNTYDSLGDYPKAIGYHEQALAMARQIGDRQGEGAALGNLGNTYYSLGDYPKAMGYYEQALAISRQIGDRQGEGAALGNLGLAYHRLGDYPKAIGYHEQHLAMARQIEDRHGEGNALGNLGLASDSLGDYPKAMSYHEQALAISRQIGDRHGEGSDLGNLGLAYYNLGDYPKAISYYEQHLAVARQIGDRQGEGAALGNLGLAYHRLGDYPKAMGYHEQHLAISRQIGDRQGEGNALGNLGNAYGRLGDYPRAIGYYEQHLAMARQIEDRHGEGNALGNLGNAYGSLGDYAQAISCLVAASLIYRQILGPSLKIVLGTLQSMRYQVGDAEFERLAAEAFAAQGATLAAYRPMLEQGGVFAPPTLDEYQKGLVELFSRAALLDEQAAMQARQWVVEHQENPAWAALAAAVERMLAGERSLAKLLDPSRALDEIDRAIIKQALADAAALEQPAPPDAAPGTRPDGDRPAGPAPQAP